ncbi:MAG: hypothetical protein HY897_03600 [Deltaproteobacteria bacterium]|nr:hypothetical protein [Deltaproteobacteria bacterium]
MKVSVDPVQGPSEGGADSAAAGGMERHLKRGFAWGFGAATIVFVLSASTGHPPTIGLALFILGLPASAVATFIALSLFGFSSTGSWVSMLLTYVFAGFQWSVLSTMIIHLAGRRTPGPERPTAMSRFGPILKVVAGIAIVVVGIVASSFLLLILFVGGFRHPNDASLEKKLKADEAHFTMLIEHMMEDELITLFRVRSPVDLFRGRELRHQRGDGKGSAPLSKEKERWYSSEMERLGVDVIRVERDGTHVLTLSHIGWAGGGTSKGIAFSLNDLGPLRAGLDGSVNTKDVERCAYVYKKLWGYWYLCFSAC